MFGLGYCVLYDNYSIVCVCLMLMDAMVIFYYIKSEDYIIDEWKFILQKRVPEKTQRIPIPKVHNQLPNPLQVP